MKRIGLILSIFCSFVLFSQTPESNKHYQDSIDDIISKIQVFDEVIIPENYKQRYKIALRKAKKVYPMVLYAKSTLDSLNSISKGKSKVYRKAHRELKQSLKYTVKTLYISEGVMFCKLFNRETNITVYDLMSEHVNFLQAGIYNHFAKMYNQDLSVVFDPKNNVDDYILEQVINDINSGKVYFRNEFNIVSKKEYKSKQKS